MDNQVIKSVGASGQISLGKENAGRKVLVECPEQGVWIIRTVTIVPDNERWLHDPATKKRLRAAISWAVNNPAKSSDLNQLPSAKPHAVQRKTRSA